MARRHKGRPVNGILVVDKPAGKTSNAVLQDVKRALNARKAGHTGSLDPLATGVLPLCFGEATKMSRFLLDADKEYESTFVLGESSTTGDSDGEIVACADASHLEEAVVARALRVFEGDIVQVPPMYSAIKHQGQPLYKLAREGKEVERGPRHVTVYRLDMLAFRPGSRAEVDVRIRCSKGTYVRSIAEDLGKALGCGAHVSALCRTRSGPFRLAQATSLARILALAEARDFDALNALLLPMDMAVESLPRVELNEDSGYYLRQGQPVLAPNLPTAGMVRIELDTGEFLGIGEILDDGRLAPRRLVMDQ